MIRTNNPVRDAEQDSIERESRLQNLPVCAQCGDPIQQVNAFYRNREWVCDDCLGDFRRCIDAG